MNAKYVNIFLETCTDIVKRMTGIELTKDKVFTKTSTIETNNVVTFIGITGEVRGTVVFGLTLGNSYKLASAIMGGMEITELNELSTSALQEMSNIIMGNVASAFSKMGIMVDITPPTLLKGNDISIFQGSKPIVCVMFKMDIGGEFEVDIRIE